MANHLFLVGIDNYLYHGHLNNCVKDLTDFKELLLEKYAFEDDGVQELYNQIATAKAIQDVLIKYSSSLSLQDNLIIYFSGHGHYDSKIDRGYWMPVEGTHNYTTWIPNDTIITLLGQIDCKHILLISDSCFSNSFFSVNPTKGFKDYSNYKSRWAFTSSFELAYDSIKGENGPFAKAILDYLQHRNLDFRVGELIEYVKVVFSASKFQSPQGSALYCKGHSGGEMVFKIRQEIDKRDLKGYKDFKKALKLYKNKSDFIELVRHEDQSAKIGFQIFQEVDPVIKKLTYYLYLYEGARLNATYQYILNRFSQVFKEKNLIVFLPKGRTEIDPTTRLGNVVTKFRPINCFYIDDFILKQCTPELEIDRSKFLSISNFILPTLANGLEREEVHDFIVRWFGKESEPILAVKGTGGIGKTTFVQFIADVWLEKSPNTHVLFIDSVNIRDILIRFNKFSDNLGIYSFYQAYCELSGTVGSRLTEELFALNMDAGNLLIIIDGLDEVISKVPNFHIDIFLESIKRSSTELGGGKVIITCRTHFWDLSDIGNVDLSVIELEPFDFKQAKLFFEKSLDSNTKVKKALELAEHFKLPNGETENLFHPYVLDIIRSIISSNRESIGVDLSQFSSKILLSSIKNDYIIYRICDRERKRIGQLPVDDQINYFMHLATDKRGIIKQDNLRQSVEACLGKKVDSNVINALKAHPFLKTTDSSLMFRYDFLSDFFKSIFIAAFFDFDSGRTSFNETFVDLVDENCWYGSGINQDIVNRIFHWQEFDLLSISELVNQISNSGVDEQKKIKSIAHIFNIALQINQKWHSNDIESNTRLLKGIFQNRKGNVVNFALINISYDHQIRFDFSGLTFIKGHIEDYGSFYDCKFDDQTRFAECKLLKLKARNEKNMLSKEHLIDCLGDTDLEESLQKFQEAGLSRIEQAKVFINNFLHLFFSSGRLGRQWEHKIIAPRFAGVSQNRFNYNESIKIFKQHNLLIITKEKGQTKMAINEDCKEDVVRFIKDGTISTLISNIIIDLSND
jgi:hypothetical protein